MSRRRKPKTKRPVEPIKIETNSVADDMVSGLACQQCGQFLSGRAPGHPRTCTDCGGDTRVIAIEDEKDLK